MRMPPRDFSDFFTCITSVSSEVSWMDRCRESLPAANFDQPSTLTIPCANGSGVRRRQWSENRHTTRLCFLMKSSLAENTGSEGGGEGGMAGPADPGPKPRLTGGVGVSDFVKNVGSQVTIRFAPAFTALPSTSNDASAVVTIPVTAVEGSPALNVSTVYGFQSTPMFFLIRSTISCAVTALPIERAISPSGAVATPVAVSATNLRREI